MAEVNKKAGRVSVPVLLSIPEGDVTRNPAFVIGDEGVAPPTSACKADMILFHQSP